MRLSDSRCHFAWVLCHQKGEVSVCYPQREYTAACLPLCSRNPLLCTDLTIFFRKKKDLENTPLMWWAFISSVQGDVFFFQLRWLSNLIEKVGVVRAMNLCRSTSVHSLEYSNPRELELVSLGSMLMTPTYWKQ